MANPGLKKDSLASKIGGFLLAGLFFLGFPTLWTAMAPVSYVRLTRDGDRVKAAAKTCLLFCIPYHIETLDDVSAAESKVRDGGVTRHRDNSGRTRSVQADDEGTLTLGSDAKSISVSVSPVSLESKKKAVEAFLADPAAKELNLFCVSNWKFGLIFAIPLSGLALLFVLGISLGALKGLLALFGIHVAWYQGDSGQAAGSARP